MSVPAGSQSHNSVLDFSATLCLLPSLQACANQGSTKAELVLLWTYSVSGLGEVVVAAQHPIIV